MKKLLSILLALAMVMALLVGCGPSNSTPPTSGDDSNTDANSGAPTVVSQEAVDEALAAAESAGLPDASGDAPQTIIFSGSSFQAMSEAEELFKFMMEDLSGGSVKIEWHPYNELGDDLNVVTNVQFGEIGIGISSPAPLTTMLPNMSIFDTLYMINDQETAYEVMDGEIGQQIDKDVEALGMKVIMWCENGFRNLTCNVEVTGLDSLKGIKVRTMENSLQMDAWKALGANPTPADFSELYMSLEQGTLDAQENPYDLIVANKLYEPQAYVIETNHLLHTLNMVGSKATYDALPADIQQLVSECAAEAHQYARQMADERIEGQKSTIQDAGLEIITLEPAMIQEMADVSANVYDLVREQIGTDLVDSLLAQVETASAAE